ncbi:chromosome transmission fidelity protein [Acrasis kona]|uniref:Chromosome transmission fidelity protein n=1 Tax=Acrasis kona TaxID=1008807 RepID=A0AAW2ZEV0_9EUKA
MSKRGRDIEDNEMEALLEMGKYYLNSLINRNVEQEEIQKSSKRVKLTQPQTKKKDDQYLTSPPKNNEYITVTGDDGDVFYVPLSTCEEETIEQDEQIVGKFSYLSTPIEDLMDEVLRTKHNKAETPIPSVLASTTQLYVDKYTPKGFTDLLSNERINREVLSWVKEWDPIVFNKPYAPPVKPINPFFKKTPQPNLTNANPQKGPEHKILLISGPPGVGKTTLAHIIAKQAGYHPVEINASDDRSRDRLMTLIEGATQMCNNMFGDKKPNLVILDEIDGLENNDSRSAITALLQLAYPLKPSTKKTTSADSKSKKKKTATVNQLNRPIICICNDHYAPVLRELRYKSKVIVFGRSHTDDKEAIQRMANRLHLICNKEKLTHVDKNSLVQMAACSNGDVRSCLNAIQFNGGDGLGGPMDKDRKSDYFDVLGKVFVKKSTNTKELVDNHPDQDKILLGCFENYLDVKFDCDRNWSQVRKALDYVGWMDMINVKVRSQQAFALMCYQSFPIMNFAKQCGSIYSNNFHKKGRLTYAKTEMDCRTKKSINHNVCGAIVPKLIQHNCASSKIDIYTEMIPMLVALMQPSALMQNQSNKTDQLLSVTRTPVQTDVEKKALNDLIEMCHDYGITFKYTSVMGKQHFVMDPPIDTLSMYKSLNAPIVKSNKFAALQKEEEEQQSPILLSYQIKRLIANGVDMYKTNKINSQQQGEQDKMKPPTKKYEPPTRSKYCAAPQTSKIQANLCDYSVYFQYREGNSNAVRRLAKISEFI